MSGRRIINFSVVCVLVGLLVPELSHAQRYRQSTTRTNSRQSQQKMMEERQKQFEERVARQKAEREKWMTERQKEFEQRAKDRANGKDARRNESIKQALEMTDTQWKVVEPKINRIYFLKDQSSINIAIGGTGGYRVSGSSGGGAVSTGTGMAGGYGAQSSSSSGSGGGGIVRAWSGPLWRLADRELTEGEKSCERLRVLLEDKDSKDEQIEQEIVALRQARENAAKELARARRELREVLVPRQQARLVLTGLLD